VSTDTSNRSGLELKKGRRLTQQLLDAAHRDTDAVSVFCDAADLDSTVTAIFVVKGREHIEYVRALCERQGLLTPGKPVEPEPAALTGKAGKE